MDPAAGNGAGARDLLVVDGLRSGFGANTVLHGVDFTVREKEIVALLGLNGAGKSVTLKVIAGIVPAWAGHVHMDGRPITSVAAEDRVERGMAHVTQGRQVFPDLTVEENLRLGAYVLRRRNRARYTSILNDLFSRFPRLAERRAQAAGTLSGGEQAMLALARALVSEPRLVLIDEPTAGLAPIVVDEFLSVLREVNDAGVTILLVEQHVPFALKLADRVLIMQRGQIVTDARVDALDHGAMVRALGIGRLLHQTAAAARPRKTLRRPPEPVAKKRVAAKKAPIRKPAPTKKRAATKKRVPARRVR